MRVAIFGGSFDPPHVAHVLAAAYVLSIGAVDRVLAVPVFAHAFGKRLAPFPDRLELARRAFAPLRAVEVSDIEASLPTPSYTLQTARELARREPGWRLRLLVGADVLSERRAWHGFEELERLAPLLALGRVGHPTDEAPAAVLPDVSSTRVRELLARRPLPTELAALVPAQVLDYAAERGLYGLDQGA